MEEVVGSIPTRSTIFFNNLEAVGCSQPDICVIRRVAPSQVEI